MTDRDIKPDNVVSLAAERIKRVEGAAETAHAHGVAMELMRYAYDDRFVGYDPDPGDPSTEVIVIINGYMKGIAMSASDAVALGRRLVLAGLNAPSKRRAEIPEMVREPKEPA